MATKTGTEAGDVVGMTLKGGRAWLGIPYARPPIDSLRWRAPRPAESWPGVLATVRPGSPCSQPTYGHIKEGHAACFGSEDCLFLNVWSPSFATCQTPLPVMVWFHGGSNAIGQGANYDGRFLAQSQGVVVVTVNFRLGCFGWFTHPALRTPDLDRAEQSGNFGTLDQIAALRWVRDNILGFGGDPGCVTIFGQSDGANDVLVLLTCPLAAGLFHRAIAQSPDLTTTPVIRAEQEHSDGGDPRSSQEFLIHLLLQDLDSRDRQFARKHLSSWSDEQIRTYFLRKSYIEFDAASRVIEAQTGGRRAPTLFEDGYVIPDSGLLSALASDRCSRVPVILGCTRDEFTGLILIAGGVPSFLEAEPDRFSYRIKDRRRLTLALEYLNAIFFVNGVSQPAEHLASRQADRIFAYRFDWDSLSPPPWMEHFPLGATHGLDVPCVFGTAALGPEFFHLSLMQSRAIDDFRMLANTMMSYWATFARTGRPGRGGNFDLPEWRAVDSADGGVMMVFEGASGGGPSLDPMPPPRLALIERLRMDPRLGTGRCRKRFLEDLDALRWAFKADDQIKITPYEGLTPPLQEDSIATFLADDELSDQEPRDDIH